MPKAKPDIHDPIETIRDAVRRIDALLVRAEKFKANEPEENKWLDPLEGFAGWLQGLKDDVTGDFPEEGASISSEDLYHFDEAIGLALDDRVHSLHTIVEEFEAWATELRQWLHDAELEYDKQQAGR